MIIDSYANISERDKPEFKEIFAEMVKIYQEMGRLPEAGSLIQQTREWEYPYAVINAKIEPGLTCLDMGGGGGPLGKYLARKGCKVKVIDIGSNDNIYDNSQRLWGYHPKFAEENLVYEKGDFNECEIEQYDRVFCIGVIEHLKSEQKQKLAWERIPLFLKPGGIAVVTWDVPPSTRPDRLNYHCDVLSKIIIKEG